MKNSTLALLGGLVIFASTFRAQNIKTMEQDSNKFSQLSDQFVKTSLALLPVSASQAGYHKHLNPQTGKTIELDGQLDDVSAAAVEQQLRFYREWRQRFQRETPVGSLSAQDSADYRMIEDQIALGLLELEEIQNYKHNPTVYVELLGNGLFLPLSQEYAAKEVRLGHVISRIGQIPRFLEQAKAQLVDADPIFTTTALEENQGNLDQIEQVGGEISTGSPLKPEYEKVAPQAKKALTDFNEWLENDLAKRAKNGRTWRLGADWYGQKFHSVMQTSIEPAQLLKDAEAELARTRAEMLKLALPLYKQWFPGQEDYAGMSPHERENKIIRAVLEKTSEEHPQRDQLIDAVKGDLDGIIQFIREKKIVSLSSRDNLKVIPTPEFMRGIYSVAGFHGPPPLEPTAEAQYWVTPIDAKMPEAKAESKLREYNNYTLKWLTIHEALPGHYIQFEHANDVQPVIRRLIRNLFANGPYVEGWAEYIADVMTEQGFLDFSPKFQLMRMKVWLRATANTILDIRMQTMNMSDQEAMDLMLNETFQTQAEAEGKLRRAKLSSAQLPTYFLGARQWWTLRKNYERASGNAFTLVQFHDRALDQGALPLESLERIILPQKQ
jgi:uncharacterized protein (DUF885 family)